MSSEDFIPEEYLHITLRQLGLTEASFAELINVEEDTLLEWLEEGRTYYGCTLVVMRLLSEHPRELVELLREDIGLRESAREPWSVRVSEVRKVFDLSKSRLAEFLGTSIGMVSAWENGERDPSGCYAVLVDLLYHKPREMADLLGLVEEEGPKEVEWPKERLMRLLGEAGIQPTELMGLLGMGRGAWTTWIYGDAQPGACAAFFLELIERYPEQTLSRLRGVSPEPSELWDAERVKAVRKNLGLKLVEFAEIFGVDHETVYGWERDGLPKRYPCTTILYSLLDKNPERFLKLVTRRERFDEDDS